MTSQKVFNFNHILKDKELYNNVKKDIETEILNSFSIRKNKAILSINSENIETTIGDIYIKLLMAEPYVLSNIFPDKEHLFNFSEITQEAIEEYINIVYSLLKEKISYDDIRILIYKILNEASDISGKANNRKGNTVSFTNLLKLSVDDPEANEIFHPVIENGQFNYIEKQFSDYSKKAMNYFKKNEKSELHPFVIAGTGVNAKQLTQCISFVGLKPNIDGTVIPVTIKDNFLVGLSSIQNYFINAKGTRLALLMNNKMTKKSGYLTRKLSLSNIDHYHDNSIDICDTKHFVKFNVSSERKLRMIIGRHYYALNDLGEAIGELKTVYDNSNYLIGTTIGLMSPITCSGKHVCSTCYGKELSEINKDVNTGLVAVLRLTEPLTQKMLSAKHCATCC